MTRIAITGSSGYLGSRLVQHYRARDCEVLGLDICEPGEKVEFQPSEFRQLDICDTELTRILAGFQPNTIIHGAYAFKPSRDEEKMRRINVDGTQNVLDAAADTRPDKLMVISSATAYGAWPDNAVPMDESHRLRAREEFRYAADKTKVEGMLDEFEQQHPEIQTAWVRPSIIGGPNLDNYLSRFLFGMPFLVLLDGVDGLVQFVHEDDVVAAIEKILQSDSRGPFNVAPPDWLKCTQIAKQTNRKTWRWPFWLAKFLHGFAWTIRFPIHESPASFLYFCRYPWVVAPQRLQKELDFEFKYSSQQTLDEIIRMQELAKKNKRKSNG